MKVAILFPILLMSLSAYSQKNTHLENLVETEKNFAKSAAEKGTKSAFLQFFAEDGLVFQPQAVNAKEFWKTRPESGALLSWTPVWADIDGEGTLGYTTGPWEFRPKGKDGEPVAFGQYVTIWKMQDDGTFKAVLDIGISHDKFEGTAGKINYPRDAAAAGEKPKDLLGPFKYPKDSIGIDTRLYRDGEFPIVGNAVSERLKLEDRQYEDSGGKCNVESAGLRYCYGIVSLSFESKKPVRGNYLQIHKFRSGKWEVVLDLFSALPNGEGS